MIVEFILPQAEAVLLQSILQGEDGLATIRCLDPEKKKQQFWTTPEQLDDLYQWLDLLPHALNVVVTGQWLWREDAKVMQGETNE